MRVARIWKKPQSLFIPGWIAAVVGGTVLIFLLIYVAALPWGDARSVDAGELPLLPSGSVEAGGGDLRVDLLPNGTVVSEGWTPASTCRIYIHRKARWIAIRTLLNQLRADGLREARIVVRKDDGLMTQLHLDLQGDWPKLDVNAPAQEFVNTLR